MTPHPKPNFVHMVNLLETESDGSSSMAEAFTQTEGGEGFAESMAGSFSLLWSGVHNCRSFYLFFLLFFAL